MVVVAFGGSGPGKMLPNKTKKKKRRLKGDGVLAAVGLTEEDQLLSLMDQMEASIKGGVRA
jgi:hypothetical protein